MLTGGQVLISESTAKKLGKNFDLERLPELKVKGRNEAVPVFRVEWAEKSAATVALPKKRRPTRGAVQSRKNFYLGVAAPVLLLSVAMMSDDFAAHLIICSLRQDLLRQKVAFAVVRAAINDLLAVSSANSWKRRKLVLGSGIDVN